ncbi:MAG: LamG domain-containing protein, partial [Planctomycetaceae bacterium]|nr:LamG domain-containing protein [Planctomycetaceae bacterium]
MKKQNGLFNRLISFLFGNETTRKIESLKKRKLSFETLENRELLSANIIDDDSQFYDESYYSNQSSVASYSNNFGDFSTSYYSETTTTTIPSPIYLNKLLEDGNSTFNGTSNYFQIADSNLTNTLDQLTNITVVARFTTNTVNSWEYILTHDVETNRGNELFFRIRGNKLQFGYWTTSYNVLAETQISANTQYDAAGTYDGTNWKLYLNGNLVATTSDANRDIGVSNTSVDGDPLNPVWLIGGDPLNPVWLIGAHGGPYDRRFFNGAIDVVAIYDTALSEEQIDDVFDDDNWSLSLDVPTNVDGS